MQVFIVPVTQFQQNCSVLICESTKQAAFVDPGGDIERLEQLLTEQGATLEKILQTHAHIDHAGETAAVAEAHGVPIEGPHREDQFLIDQLPEQSARFGFPPSRTFEPARWLDQGDTVTVGEETLSVHHCPGHTPGHVVFFHGGRNLAIVGDVLFQGSIGRTDLPRGNYQTLIESITTRLWPLGDDVDFIPGHGPMSTIGAERRGNPFVSDMALGNA
tara:strand:- start:31 stop:681 length:651 start_codon:yes stop_codon:yes gene_type:complete